MQTTRKENQTVTSKKHDKRCLVKPNESAIHVEPNKTVTKKESNDDLEWIKSILKLTNELNDARLEEVKENEEDASLPSYEVACEKEEEKGEI